jgi:hypothetical protein
MASSNKHRTAAFAMAALLGASAVAAPLREARADNVSPKGKGTVGGALLGAEIPTIVEGIAGVHSGWVYLISAIVGAGGGGVVGFEVEQNSNDGKAPMYLLAGGLALVIPALVLTLNATRYQPEEGATEDRAPTGPAAEPGAPGGSSITATPAAAPAPPPPAPVVTPPPPPPLAPQSMLDVRVHSALGAFRMGVPVPDVKPAFSVAEARAYGLKDNPSALYVPVLHVAF